MSQDPSKKKTSGSLIAEHTVVIGQEKYWEGFANRQSLKILILEDWEGFFFKTTNMIPLYEIMFNVEKCWGEGQNFNLKNILFVEAIKHIFNKSS